MQLIPLSLPPGVYRNGTEYQSQGRWFDASLVRWVDKTMQPVGGWEARAVSAVTTSAPRSAHSWQTLAGDRYIAFGSADQLVLVDTVDGVNDITPADLTAGIPDTAPSFGFGTGAFGAGTFGTPRTSAGTYYSEATTWTLDNWGQDLIACSSADKRILYWDPGASMATALAVPNAPTQCLGAVVTDERFLFALGAGGNPRKVQWSDREDLETWTPTPENEAGDLELQTNGQILQAVRTRGQLVIITDQDAHTATYLGPPFVYGIERVGTSCGAISRAAAASVDAGVFWMGQRSFFAFSGGAVQPIASDVSDYVFSRIDRTQLAKVWAVPNGRYGEIWWFYQSAGAVDVDSYVCYSFRENHWAVGSLARTCGVDAGVFSHPVYATASGALYDHESGYSYDGAELYATSGPIELPPGEFVITGLDLYPDERTQGGVEATFYTRFYPNGEQGTHGPYSLANPTSVRFTGRQLSMRVSATGVGGDWRVGIPRLQIATRGKR